MSSLETFALDGGMELKDRDVRDASGSGTATLARLARLSCSVRYARSRFGMRAPMAKSQNKFDKM